MSEKKRELNLSVTVCHVCGSKLHRDMIGKEWCANPKCQVYDVRFTIPVMEQITHPLLLWLMSGRVAREWTYTQKDELSNLLSKKMAASHDAVLNYFIYTGGEPVPIEVVKDTGDETADASTATLGRIIKDARREISRRIDSVELPESLTRTPRMM